MKGNARRKFGCGPADHPGASGMLLRYSSMISNRDFYYFV